MSGPESTAEPWAHVGDDVAGVHRQRDDAVARCRQLEHEVGELRGRVKRMELMMWRRTARRQRWLGRARRVLAMVPRFDR